MKITPGEYIGVDLDGTLARWTNWGGPHEIGEPIPLMVERVKDWLRRGVTVKIFTARVCGGDPQGCRPVIQNWCRRHLGMSLDVTAEKHWSMVEFWDDRAVQVVPNTGLVVGGAQERLAL